MSGRSEGLLLAIEGGIDGVVADELWDNLFHLANRGHVVVLAADGDELVDVAADFLEVVLADGGDADLLVERGLGVLLSGRMSVKDGILYIVFQCIGAFIGSALLYLLTTNSGLVGTGANDLQAGVTTLGGLLAEIIFTCVFVLVVLGATSKTNGATNNFAGLAIGLSLVLVHLVCIRYTGTSVNPARSLAPAFFQGGSALSNLWIFIVGPFAGAILAAGIWGIIAGCNCKKEEK